MGIGFMKIIETVFVVPVQNCKQHTGDAGSQPHDVDAGIKPASPKVPHCNVYLVEHTFYVVIYPLSCY
jgi:hypothetical protein